MERKESYISLGADFNNIRSDKSVGFIQAVFLNLAQIGNGFADVYLVGKAVVLLEKCVNVADVLLIARKNIEQYNLVAFFTERRGNEYSR